MRILRIVLGNKGDYNITIKVTMILFTNTHFYSIISYYITLLIIKKSIIIRKSLKHLFHSKRNIAIPKLHFTLTSIQWIFHILFYLLKNIPLHLLQVNITRNNNKSTMIILYIIIQKLYVSLLSC